MTKAQSDLSAAPLDLAGDFPTPDYEQWRQLAEKTLKGADFEARLVSHSADGIRLEPLYMQDANAQAIPHLHIGQPWAVATRIDHPDPARANRLALADLEGGAAMLSLVTQDAACAHGYGVTLTSVADFEALLKDISLDMVRLRLEPCANGMQQAALLAASLASQGIAADKANVHFGLSPITALFKDGELPASKDAALRDLATTLLELRKQGFSGPLVTCDVRPMHEAGASEAQELAAALAMGVDYLRGLSQNGVSLGDAAAALSWTVAVDADQFMGVAKLRALRLLWMRIEEASGLPQRTIEIHAETAWRMMSRLDPAVNILRTTVATATACFGGADSIAVLPYTQPLGLPDAFARRLARNTQVVLAEESHLWRVMDPAAGSGAYEALTHELCEAAWTAFQEIEAEGGIVESFMAGHLQAQIAAIRTAREKAIACRALPLTGTSKFPNLIESPDTHVLDVLPPPPTTDAAQTFGSEAPVPADFAGLIAHFREGSDMAGLSAKPDDAGRNDIARAPTLPCVRLSAPFEALRDAAADFAEATGTPLRVFIVTLGPRAEHGARATWTENLLAAGGVDALASDVVTNAEDIGKAFSENATPVACICGTDDMYSQLAEETASALKRSGAQAVYLIGKPGQRETLLRDAGIDGFLYSGIDVLAALTDIQSALGVKA